MSKRGPKRTNELEFQGQVLGWINEEIQRRPGLELDRASQEKPHPDSKKRSDLVVWKDRSSEVALLAIELKTPTTPINDPNLFSDAIRKAQFWHAPYFAIWNMVEAELYMTPSSSGLVTPADALKRWAPQLQIRKIEDWLRPEASKLLQARALDILEVAWQHGEAGQDSGYVIDAEIFVSRLSDAISQLRQIIYKELTSKVRTDARLRRTVNNIAAAQGFKGFVEDIEFAIAGQIGYRLIGQILFYLALRRKQTSLRPLVLEKGADIPTSLQTFWNDVRRFDYEALFRPEALDNLVRIPKHGQTLIRSITEQLASYDWASLTDDVLGSIFEHLIPREEQILLGQFYTPRPVADLLVALTIDGERPTILDPGCGSGTFLMSAYEYLADRTGMSHRELLPIIWGFDLSPFAAELAAINLFRQNLAEFDNFPRIVPGNFFDRQPGESVDFRRLYS